MRSFGRGAFPVSYAMALGLVLSTLGIGLGQDSKKADRAGLEMSKAVVCKKVEGYEKFTTLPDSALTSEDKLVVYYRPLHFQVKAVDKPKPGHRFRAKFTQDGRVRRKGDKAILMKKDLILEYEPYFETTSERLYLMNNLGLKGLPPGDYEYDIVLHDGLDEGSQAVQTVPFTVIPTPKVDPPKKEEGPDGPEGPPGPEVESKPSKKAGKSS